METPLGLNETVIQTILVDTNRRSEEDSYSLSYVVRICHTHDGIIIDLPNQQGDDTVEKPNHSVVLEIINGSLSLSVHEDNQDDPVVLHEVLQLDVNKEKVSP